MIWNATRLWIVAVSLASAPLAQAPLGQQRQAPVQPLEKVEWRSLAVSIAAHGAASGLDAWTSWQRPERNGLLADGGRFTASSAYKKAGLFAGVSVVEVLVVKKWGKKHPWIARAFRMANFSTAGMLTAGAVPNLGNR
jgi:hypothetical protein